MRNTGGVFSAALLLHVLAGRGSISETIEPPRPVFRVRTQVLEPREHPDYGRRHVQPPSWETFGHRTQFTSLRGFPLENNRVVRFVEEIDRYTKEYDLGDVLWPAYPIVFAENLDALVAEIKNRELLLFDIWGYVPGSGPGDYWMQYRPPRRVFDLLERELGERWLGMDIGEQDGRYIGGYASQMHPVSLDRVDAYLNFQRHFERMTDELGHRVATLVSLNYGHYFLKEGLYTSIGAETAQALPNSQVYYAFIRGAGKQYGVPWFGNASVWNRWGWKTYQPIDTGAGPPCGPTKGTSLNLLKRLLYSHILYNCVFVGFESGWFQDDGLSPIGRIQQAAHAWTREIGQPGVMQTPIALMTDYFAGWTFPRHLYTDRVYRVWGAIPYGPGDYLMDCILDMVYPGYQDASYYRDESGFIVPTPYGDCVDCILSDAEPWLLKQYPFLIVAGELSGETEVRGKLETYVENGGLLVITAGNLAKFSEPICGVTVGGAPERLPKDQRVLLRSGSAREPRPFDFFPLVFAKDGATVLARYRRKPMAVEVPFGKGKLIALASPFGIHAEPAVTEIPNKEEEPLPKPYVLLEYVRVLLDGILRSQMMFEAGEGLSLITCRKEPGVYTLGICNNALEAKPFSIVSHCGTIESITELPLDASERGKVGFLPEGFEDAALGVSNDKMVAGGDVRVFSVRVREERVAEIPRMSPAPRPRGRILSVRSERTIQEEILIRPTFFEHFDGICVDWRYLNRRDIDILEKEAGWIRRQSLRVFVDATSGINLYPDLRLVNNSEEDYAESMSVIRSLLSKMAALETRDLILSLHRQPENSFTREQTWASFEETLRSVCAEAASRNIRVFLRESLKPGGDLAETLAVVRRIGAPNLALAGSVALRLDHAATRENAGQVATGLWLAGAPAYDAAGVLWTTNAPLAGRLSEDAFASIVEAAPDAPVLFDVVYQNRDDEYRDACFVEYALQHKR